MRTGGERSDSVLVTRVSTTRMAPAPAGGRSSTEGSARTTFAVGKITRRRSEMRTVVRSTAVRFRVAAGAETVH
jgi:hypothetical protein